MNPIFHQCCCCFKLETGGQIIGWINTVVGLLAAIGCTALAVFLGISEEPIIEGAKTGIVSFNIAGFRYNLSYFFQF
jgi:hypothetical protein